MRMDLIGRMLGMFAFSDFASESGFIHRVLHAMATVVAYTVLTGMLAGGLVIGLLYGGYLALLHYGVDDNVALVTVITVMALLTALTVLKVKLELSRLTSLNYRAPSPVDKIADKVRPVVDSFWEGFATGKHKASVDNAEEKARKYADAESEAPDERVYSSTQEKPRKDGSHRAA